MFFAGVLSAALAVSADCVAAVASAVLFRLAPGSAGIAGGGGGGPEPNLIFSTPPSEGDVMLV